VQGEPIKDAPAALDGIQQVHAPTGTTGDRGPGPLRLTLE